MGVKKFLVVTRHTGRSRSEATALRTRSVRACGERLPGKGPLSGPDEVSGVSGVSPVLCFTFFTPSPVVRGRSLVVALTAPRGTDTPGRPTLFLYLWLNGPIERENSPE